MKAALYRLRDEPDLTAHRVYANAVQDHYWHVGNLPEYDPALLAYAVHPHLVSLAEEVVGGRVRVEETEAIINRRDPAADPPDAGQIVPTGFHVGTRHGWGTYTENERFHCLFVKTLAYLTDVGAGDGGTAVIAGSHKMAWAQDEMIEAARQDPRLVHPITAPAGSVLLFAESLIHSGTRIRGDRERVILVTGYVPPMLREWPGNEIRPEFLQTLPDDVRPLLSGEESWHWQRRYSK